MARSVDLWEVFGRLFGAYGPRGWWPVTVRAGEPPVYRPGVYLPRDRRERDEIAFGAVLAQNTSWQNVTRALVRLTEAGIRTPADVLALPAARLAALIRSSGYFRQKARRLRTLARYLAAADPAGLATETLRAELLGLSGVGPETADSILLYGFGRPVFVVDAYTRRLAARLGLREGAPSYEQLRAAFETALVPAVPLFNEYHALIVEHGKEVCRATPRCEACPLADRCSTGRAVALTRWRGSDRARP